MIDKSRRKLLVGFGAVAASSLVPAFAFNFQTIMPPVQMVRTNGINMAVYEAGSGPAVILLHGFPGLAFTWRHQIPALVAAGYRVIVPDLRGYGLSDAPTEIESYDIAHLTADVVGLLDALDIKKAVFIGHDWGGLLAWQMALLHEARVAGVVSANTPFTPHWTLWLHPDLVDPALPKGKTFLADPGIDPIAQMREVYSPEMYVLKFQDGKTADTVMNGDPRATLRSSIRKDLMTSAQWDNLPTVVTHMEYYGQPIPDQLPGRGVLNAQELNFYVKRFERTGFTPAINWYRNLSRNWKAGLNIDQTIHVPSLMISAANDVVLRPSMADGMEAYVKDLERYVIEDCWHWTPEEKPQEFNRLVTSWLNRRFPS